MCIYSYNRLDPAWRRCALLSACVAVSLRLRVHIASCRAERSRRHVQQPVEPLAAECLQAAWEYGRCVLPLYTADNDTPRQYQTDTLKLHQFVNAARDCRRSQQLASRLYCPQLLRSKCTRCHRYYAHAPNTRGIKR